MLLTPAVEALVERRLFEAGEAAGYLVKAGGAGVSSTYSLGGRLVASKSGWGLLEVPNAIVRGLFAALHEPGVELPPNKAGSLNAHISVFTKADVEAIGGVDKLTERGKVFKYQLGPVQSVQPKGWKEMSLVYFVQVRSPELQALRKSYGLTPLPNGDHDFHITLAVKKKKVLQDNGISKAASADFDPEDVKKSADGLWTYECPECGGDALTGIPGKGIHFRGSAKCTACGHSFGVVGSRQRPIMKSAARVPGENCPHCDALFERDPDSGKCNSCGKPWDEKAAADRAHRHFRAVCRCGAVVAECGCDDADKREFSTSRPCKACRTKDAEVMSLLGLA